LVVMTPLFMTLRTHLIKTAHFSSVFSPTDENRQQNNLGEFSVQYAIIYSCSELVIMNQYFPTGGAFQFIYSSPVVAFNLKVSDKLRKRVFVFTYNPCRKKISFRLEFVNVSLMSRSDVICFMRSYRHWTIMYRLLKRSLAGDWSNRCAVLCGFINRLSCKESKKDNYWQFWFEIWLLFLSTYLFYDDSSWYGIIVELFR
jgi:hypothetical protein